jgi:ferredoxin-fold anticodon binding domain-containing protein
LLDDEDLDKELNTDNLVDALDNLMSDSGQSKKRKLTIDEMQELRGTTLVKRKNQKTEKEVTFEDFHFIMVIGRGTFGKVFLAELKTTKKLFAVKSIRKDILIQYD